MSDHPVSKSVSGVSREVLPFRRGLRLVRPLSPRALTPSALHGLRSAPKHVARGLPALHAFALLARKPLERLASADGLPPSELAADDIHDMRVAARHLRALLAAFEDGLDEEAVLFLRGELAWLQHRLAPARDWDVFIAHSLTPRADDAGVAWLLAAAHGKRDHAYAAARAALSHRRTARLVMRFRFWLDSLDFSDPGRRKVDDVMAGYLRKHFRKLLQALRQGAMSDAELHRLRLRMKKVSDIGAFAKPLYRGARRRRFMRRVAHLQTSLGQRQDAVVARRLAMELGEGAPDAARRAIAIIVEAETSRIAEQTGRFEATSARLFRLKTFWRKNA